MTLWEAVFCLCRRDNHSVHPVSVAQESVPIPNTNVPVSEQPGHPTSEEVPVQNGDIPIGDEAVETKGADVVPAENQTDLVESHPEELSTMMPAEEIKTVNPALTVPLKDEKEEKNEDPVEPDLPKPIEEHQANEEEAKVPEDLQPEVKQLSVDIVAAPQVFDPVVETLEKAAWIVQSFSQDGELIDSVEVPHYEVNNLPEDKAQEEVSKSNSSQEALETKRQNSLETIKEGETVPKEKSSRVDLNGSAGKWDPNDAKAPPRSQKIIKVKATSVRENKKPLPVKSMDYGRVKNIPQVHFQAPRRNSVPLKKETKKEPKKKVEESEESQGEVVLVSPTGLTFDQLPAQKPPMIILVKQDTKRKKQTRMSRASNQEKGKMSKNTISWHL